MTSMSLESLPISELVDRFAEIAVQQDQVLLRNELGQFNKLYREMDAIEQELKRRPGDQRRALTSLYHHQNAQVRLKAAARSLAVERDGARRVLENLVSSRKYPQAGDAGLLLDGLDRGQFQPR